MERDTSRVVDIDSEREKFQLIKPLFGAHHIFWLECLQKVENGEIPRLMGLMPPGSAKALALDTPIPTPTGWTVMGDLKAGDSVFDEQGQPCRVKWVSPVWKNRPVYEVTTDCGDKIIADHDHEWLVSLCRKPGRRPSIKETHELANHRRFGRGGEVSTKPRAKRPMISRAKALILPRMEFLLEPYILGAWLGDGNTTSPNLSCGAQDIEWWESELTRLGVKFNTHSHGDNFSISMLEIREKFRLLNLMGGSPNSKSVPPWGNKFIPAEYFRGSLCQRLSLLQGLIDTDGTVARSGMTTFTNTNYSLCCGVAELVRSLGAKASLTGPHKAMLNGKECAPYYRVFFYLEHAARMPRKAQYCRANGRTPNTYIDVTPCGRADTVCIEVDSPSHLFLCGESMTPTHNSSYTSVVFPTHYLGRYPNSLCIMASYGSELPRRFGRMARTIVEQPLYKRIFDASLSATVSAADEWAITNGSEWMGRGILTGITGNRADLVIWDDLIKNRQDADSDVIRNRTWEEYKDSLRSRKKPNAREVGITCMVGSTSVTMADGVKKDLKDVRPGDWVASYYEDKIVPSKVLNWRNCGPDNVFTIKTDLGTTVTANLRHPFLVERNGRTVWTRLKNMNVGDRILRVIGEKTSTYKIILDGVTVIDPAGYEDVFDVEIDKTENFIANDVISHNTRWHEDDIAGRILPEDYEGKTGWVDGRDGNRWYVVCLAAECERDDDPLGRKPGDVLWPEYFSPAFFAPMKLDQRAWSSLYQQRPAPASGIFFEDTWLKYYTTTKTGTDYPERPPRETLHVYGASDYAVTANGGDYTVHIVIGVDSQHRIWLLDLWRKQASSDQWVESFCDLVQKWKPIGWAEENGQIKAGVGPFLTKRLRERRLFIARAQFPTKGDKEVRAQSIRGRMAMDGIYVPIDAPWLPQFKKELLSFPAGRNDDQVDALGLIGQILDKMIAGRAAPTDAAKPKVLSTDPAHCTVTLDDLFEANERRHKSTGNIRIH